MKKLTLIALLIAILIGATFSTTDDTLQTVYTEDYNTYYVFSYHTEVVNELGQYHEAYYDTSYYSKISCDFSLNNDDGHNCGVIKGAQG